MNKYISWWCFHQLMSVTMNTLESKYKNNIRFSCLYERKQWYWIFIINVIEKHIVTQIDWIMIYKVDVANSTFLYYTLNSFNRVQYEHIWLICYEWVIDKWLLLTPISGELILIWSHQVRELRAPDCLQNQNYQL